MANGESYQNRHIFLRRATGLFFDNTGAIYTLPQRRTKRLTPRFIRARGTDATCSVEWAQIASQRSIQGGQTGSLIVYCGADFAWGHMVCSRCWSPLNFWPMAIFLMASRRCCLLSVQVGGAGSCHSSSCSRSAATWNHPAASSPIQPSCGSTVWGRKPVA